MTQSSFQPVAEQSPDPGLDQPWYGIGFGQAVVRWLRKYAMFSGRASRGEYWWVALANGLVGVAITIPLVLFGVRGESAGIPPVGWRDLNALGVVLRAVELLWDLATLVPSFALAVRRLHDIGRSGWWPPWSAWSP